MGIFLTWSLRGGSEPASQAPGLAWIVGPGPNPTTEKSTPRVRVRWTLFLLSKNAVNKKGLTNLGRGLSATGHGRK